MTITNGYATLDEAKAWIGISENDVRLENVVTSVSRWIDQYCQRHFWKTAAGTARVFCPATTTVLRFGPFNDLAISSGVTVKTDTNGDGTYDLTWDAADYELLPRNADAAPEQRPYRRVNAIESKRFSSLVQVTGTWGWPDIPMAIKQACLIQAARIYKRRDAPEGVIAFADFGVVRMQGRLDPDVYGYLEPYRQVPVLVA